MNEEQIQKILNDYKKKREREIQHYHNVKKHDPIFIEKNRLRAKQYYEKNNDKYKQKYLDNRDYQIARSSFEYHKKKGSIHKYKNKYPERFNLLVEKGYVINDDESKISNDC